MRKSGHKNRFSNEQIEITTAITEIHTLQKVLDESLTFDKMTAKSERMQSMVGPPGLMFSQTETRLQGSCIRFEEQDINEEMTQWLTTFE